MSHAQSTEWDSDVVRVAPERFDAVLFDLDGVVTDTARVHAGAWARMFDDFLKRRASEEHLPFDAL